MKRKKTSVEGCKTFPKADNTAAETTKGSEKNSTGSIIDIPKNKEGKKELIESERRYRSLFDNSLDAILLTIPDGRIIAANPAACEMFGRSDEEFRKVGRAGIVDLSDPRLESLLKERKRKGSAKGELYFFRKDGSRFPAEVTSSIFADSSGNQKTSMIIRDISDRVNLIKELQQSEVSYRNMFMNNPQPMLIFDLETLSFLEVNNAAIKHYGFTRDEFLSMTVKDIRPPEDMASFREYLNNTREQLVLAGEWRHQKKNKEIIIVEIISHAITYNGRKARHVMALDVTERRRAEDKLIEKDIQFRKLSANFQDMIFQFTRKNDGSYCVPIASEGIKNLFGCSPEDVVNDFSPISKVIHPDDLPGLIEAIEDSARNITQFTYEFRVRLPELPDQWIFARSTPEKLPDGSVNWYGFNANITYLKNIEESLQQSEERFRRIYEDGPSGIVLVNKSMKYEMANRAFCRLVGYSMEELKSFTFLDITHPDDRARGVKNFSELIKGTIREYSSEKRYIRKDGEEIWVSITITAINDQDGQFLYSLGIVEDINKRKKAEDEFNILNTRLKLLIGAIKSIATSYSMKSIMHTVNTTAGKIMNAKGSSFILREGEYCYFADENAITPLFRGKRFLLKDCISGWVIRNKKQAAIKDIYSEEKTLTELYKGTFVKSLAISPIRQNDPLGAIEVYWDKYYEPSPEEFQLLQTLADATAKAVENIHLIEGLEKRISERTSELQTLYKEMEAFSYSVSHDLKAPLRHINGFAEILVKQFSELLPESGRNHLNTIIAAAKKMGVLIDDLLKFSRTGSTELKKSFHNMEQIVMDSLNQIKPSAGQRNIKWTIEKLPEVYGDYNLLRLVWENLIDNAVKYTRLKETGEITIGHRVEGSRQVFFIKDNGAGFDMRYADKLFGVFQRMHSQNDFEGTGIGLANVRRIITRHGGETWAESQPDMGSTFYFSLPKKPAIL